MSKILLRTILIFSCFCLNLYAESSTPNDKEIIYEYEDVAPIKRQSEALNKVNDDYSPINVDQYEGDHDFWWYQKNQKKYRFYFAMAIPYNLGLDLEDLTLGSLNITSDITDADGNTVVAAGSIDANQTGFDWGTTGGMGVNIKYGIEYYEVVRFDLELGSKQLWLDSFIAGASNGSVTFSFDDDDASLYYNYAGLNLTFEWARGLKSISPFAGVSFGGGYFSTSGLGDDFTPYTQANLGFSYRFSDKVVLEVFAQSMIISDDFSFDYELTINSVTDSTSTYEDLSANAVIPVMYDQSTAGDLVMNSIVIGYRFLF